MRTWKRSAAIAAAAALSAAMAVPAFAEEENTKFIADGTTLTIFCDFTTAARAYYNDLGDNPVVKKMEEETGLNLEFIHAPAGDDGSYFQQLLASGDLPDIMYGNVFQNTYPGGVEGAIEDGLLLDVTELVENNAPNFWALCDAEEDPDIQRKLRGDSGSIIKFGTTFLPPTDNHKIFNGLVVREDWLEKYDLEAPVTIEDYTNVLRVFKENGVEIPLALCDFNTNAQFSNSNVIASAFGVAVKDFSLDGEGNVIYGRSQDGYKEFLEVLKSWADEGLIDTGFVSRSINDSLKLFENGTAGMAFAHTYNVKEAVAAGPAIDSEFKLLCLELPRVNEDDVTHLSTVTSSINTYSYQISATCKNPEIAVAFLDYLMDEDTMLMTAWGTNEEVETYQINEEGNREFTEFVTNNPDGLDYDTVRALYMCQNLQIKYDETMEAAQYALEECHQSWDAWSTNNDGDWSLPRWMTLTTDESTELAGIKTKLSNYSDEMVYRFIFGEADLETEWDGFVEQLVSLGSERAEEINQAAYNRYMERPEE